MRSGRATSTTVSARQSTGDFSTTGDAAALAATVGLAVVALAGNTVREAPNTFKDCCNSEISCACRNERTNSQATTAPTKAPKPSLHAAPSTPPTMIAIMISTSTPKRS